MAALYLFMDKKSISYVFDWGYGRPMGGELQLARTVVEHLQNEF